MTNGTERWTIDAATSAALLKRPHPAEALRLCVLELIARGAWAVERVPRGGKSADVLVERDGRPDLPKHVPLMRIDALLRELGPRSAADGEEWSGSANGVELKVLGNWVRARWGSRVGFVDDVVYAQMRRAGLVKAVRDRRGVRQFEPTEEGKRLSRELRGLLKPLEGRRGRRLVGKDPVAAFAAAGALGPAVLLVGDLLGVLDDLRLDPRIANAAATGSVPVGIFGFDGGIDFGFIGDGHSGGWDSDGWDTGGWDSGAGDGGGGWDGGGGDGGGGGGDGG